MKIIRVVCTPDGVCREPGDIIERDFVPDESLTPAATRQEGGTVRAGRIEFARNAGQKPALAQESCTLIPRTVSRYVIQRKARTVVEKTADGEKSIVENAAETVTGNAYEGKLIFSIEEKERILGLGQHEDGMADYRNCIQHLYQNNMQIPMPVFLSDAGYGVLLDADCLMVYEERDNRITVTLDAVEQVAYYVIMADDLKDLVRGIRRLTGKADMLPKWAYGYIQSRERYQSQEQIRETAEAFWRRKIPVSCLVQDWQTWEEGSVYYDTIVRYIRLRYRLIPYIYSLAYRVWKEDAMIMRSLLFDYREDEKAAGVTDQYLFGDFLVCPVTFPMEYGPNSTPLNREKTREVYLPQGDGWYDYETKEYLEGGREWQAAAPVEKMPLYIRAGSILPVSNEGKTDLYHEQLSEEMELEVYGGKDGAFLCYLDSGNGYGYQRGEHAAIPISWEENTGELTLGAVEGSYPYPEGWRITLYTSRGNSTRELEYTGEETRISLR